MGNSQNNLTQDKLNNLSKETDIKSKEIKKIYKKFTQLDKDKKGFVSENDLSKIPEVEKNPLRFYICQQLSQGNQNEEIDFESFIKFLDIFKNNKSGEQFKCNSLLFMIILVMFTLFDFDKDGRISYEDLLINLKLLLGNSLNEEQISEIVEKTIQEYSSDQKYISYDEFVKILDF